MHYRPVAVTAAFLVAGPGHLTLTAAAQAVSRAAIPRASAIPALGPGLNGAAFAGNPLSLSPLQAPSLTPAGVLAAPTPAAAASFPAVALVPVSALAPADRGGTLAARPWPAAAKEALGTPASGAPLSVIASGDSAVDVVQKEAALGSLFDGSGPSPRRETLAGEVAAEVRDDAADVADVVARVNAVELKRYTARLVPWPSVHGWYRIVVAGPVPWASYGWFRDAFGNNGQERAELFTAKLEKALNNHRVDAAVLKALREYGPQGLESLDSGKYAAINAIRLTSYRAALVQSITLTWRYVAWYNRRGVKAGRYVLTVTGPGRTLISYSIDERNLTGEGERDATLFAAKLEQALKARRVKISDVKMLKRDREWNEESRRAAYARVHAESLLRYRAEFMPWPGVPGYFRVVVTGPEGFWASYGISGDRLLFGGDVGAAVFTAKLEKALNAGAVTFSELRSLSTAYAWDSILPRIR